MQDGEAQGPSHRERPRPGDDDEAARPLVELVDELAVLGSAREGEPVDPGREILASQRLESRGLVGKPPHVGTMVGKEKPAGGRRQENEEGGESNRVEERLEGDRGVFHVPDIVGPCYRTRGSASPSRRCCDSRFAAPGERADRGPGDRPLSAGAGRSRQDPGGAVPALHREDEARRGGGAARRGAEAPEPHAHRVRGAGPHARARLRRPEGLDHPPRARPRPSAPHAGGRVTGRPRAGRRGPVPPRRLRGQGLPGPAPGTPEARRARGVPAAPCARPTARSERSCWTRRAPSPCRARRSG